MSKCKNTEVTLVAAGKLIESIHYGPFSRYWWVPRATNTEFIPIRVGQKTRTFLNGREFIVRVVVGNKESIKHPGYCCESETFSSNVENSPSEAVSSLYAKIFQNKTRKSGSIVIGYDNQEIIEQLQEGVTFFPFTFYLENIKIFVFGVGTSSKPEFHNAGPGYMSSFIHTYKKNRVLFVSKIKENKCIIEIYKDYYCIEIFESNSPNEVWKVSGILQKKFDGITLFELNNATTQKTLEKHRIPTCKPNDWTNYTIMESLFKYHLKRRTRSNINWYSLFEKWINCESDIIELHTHLKSIYPARHKFGDREIGAWQCMLKSAGCYNVTPFEKNESKVRCFNY
jgi:hypothetical protein